MTDTTLTTAAPAVDEADIAKRLATLTLEQKVRLVTGADFWALHAEPDAGLRRLVLSDGPAGVRGERWDERDTSVNVPSPTALAASWDPAAIERLGALLAAEARRKGIDVLLAPTVNLHRTPFGGRHFECLSEDPLLTAQLGAAYVTGVQSGGVGACVKHFVANDSETERMTLDASVDERALRELYLAPFDVIVREAGAWSVMAAYNGVNGTSMTANPLLRDVLQREWGFDGVTMSDWFAARDTVGTGNAGLDLAMPGPVGPWGDALLAAVRSGAVSEAAVDDKVARILRLAARVGALDGVAGVATPAHFSDADAAAMVRASAAAGFVLAANDGVLPLAAAELTKVALIGPNAEVGRTLGGGSATVSPKYTISPADGIRTALAGRADVDVALGVRSSGRTSLARAPWTWRADGSSGVEVALIAADGTVLHTEPRTGGSFNWMAGFEVEGVASIEVRTTLTATDPGVYEVGGSGVGRFRVVIDGADVLDANLTLPPGADIVEGMMTPPQGIHRQFLAAGESVDVVLAHHIDPNAGGALMDIGPMFQFNIEPPHGTDDEEIDKAVALAAAADVAILVVGTTEEVESEGFDRSSLALPGRQDELVSRVAAVNPRTVVIVNSGAPVLLPWADEVAAILMTWFPGQEFGNALADVLLGDVEPGGRLPVTWPTTEAGLPSPTPIDGHLSYDEGLYIGYRWYEKIGRTPAFSFGHGLGYTTWEIETVSAPDAAVAGEPIELIVEARNTGDRSGKEVVQVYASRPGGAVERPARWLVGFAAVEAAPGASASATVSIPARALEHWDADAQAWALEAGTFVLEVGRSLADLRVSADVQVGN